MKSALQWVGPPAASKSILYFLLIISSVFFGCDDYGDTVSLSPDALLKCSDCVARATLVRVETIADWGPAYFHGDSCRFQIKEWAFTPKEILKGAITSDTLFLWTYGDSCNLRLSTRLDAEPQATCLVYGKLLREAGDLPQVAFSAMSRYPSPYKFTDWDRADSVYAAGLSSSEILSARLARQKTSGVVLAATDVDLNTFFLFRFGSLHYYDPDGTVHNLSSSEYLEALRAETGKN